MATIDRDQLLQDTKAWLPSQFNLPDSMILLINETVILRIGDDDTFYSQILCECLKANATKMMVEYSVSTSGLKREKTGQVEVEWYNTNTVTNPWKDYIKSLYTDVCPLFGYSPTKSTSLVGKAISIPYIFPVYPVVDCDCPSDVLTDFTTDQ